MSELAPLWHSLDLGCKRFMVVLALSLTLAACSSVRPARNETLSTRVRPVPPAAAVSVAKKQIGVPYRYGGEDPRSGFDCSGLVWWTYKELGSSVPRSARTLFAAGRKVGRKDLKAGDLVFFNTGGKPPAHVAIITKPPKFVHAPSTGGKVREDSLDESYWSTHFYGARRID
jgi:cell wall-associated NlpC family hydrolase